MAVLHVIAFTVFGSYHSYALHVNASIGLIPNIFFTLPSKNSTCNTIKWNGQDCGECIIDEAGNPSFDCSSVGGPDGTTIGEDITLPGDGGGETTDPPAGIGGSEGTAPPVDGGNGAIDTPQNGGGDGGSDDTTSAAGNGKRWAASLPLLLGIAGAVAVSA